jgi:hypothetical protein
MTHLDRVARLLLEVQKNMPLPTTSSHRAFERFTTDPLLCRVATKNAGVCVLRNLSIRGAYFLHPTPPPVGANVEVEFSEMPLEGYRLKGRVIRHGLGRYRGFAICLSEPHPRLLRAVYYKLGGE